jgi:pseudaminic acid cytidylyltransferase
VLIPRWRVQDIDTADDWVRAELLAPAVMKYEEDVDA